MILNNDIVLSITYQVINIYITLPIIVVVIYILESVTLVADVFLLRTIK